MNKIEFINSYIDLCDKVTESNQAKTVVNDIRMIFIDEIPSIDMNLDLGRITNDNINCTDKMYLNDLRRLKLRLVNLRANLMMEEEKEKRKLEELSLQKSILTVNNSNSNIVNIDITFDQVREKVENMTSLKETEIQEVLHKVNELENILKSSDRKAKKWENAKEIIKWIADKSVDIGIAFLPLLLKI
jgi:hypothetical protein